MDGAGRGVALGDLVGVRPAGLCLAAAGEQTHCRSGRGAHRGAVRSHGQSRARVRRPHNPTYVRDQRGRSARLQGRHRRPAHGATPGPEGRQEFCRPGAERDFAGQAGFRYHLACLWLLDQIWVVTKTASALTHSKTCYTSSVTLGLGVSPMRRRDFISFVGGGAAAWPFAARAQQAERVRRIGVLTYIAADDAEGQARLAAFTQALSQLGWSEGRNLQIDTRWATVGDVHRHAAELVALAPDVLVAATGTATVAPLLHATRTIPIVFAVVIDPVGAGFVESLARPGGNATGFTIYEYSMTGKWLELLKEIAPGVTRAAVLRDPAVASGIGQFGAVQIVAPALGVQLTPVDVRDAGEIERAVAAFASGSNGGGIVTGGALTTAHRKLIATVAARHKLPAVFPSRPFVSDGGLISYGPDLIDQFRRTAGYVDRILRGEKPADLPVQAPTKYELVINLKTAKVLGLELPATVLARADEVIE